jgi:hypothetical protein
MGAKVDQKGGGLLFSDLGTQMSDRRLFVNKVKLLEVIGDLKCEESLSRLRNGVVGLESNLRSVKTDKVGLLNIDGNGDSVEIQQRHLVEQLNQVADAQTIERARYYLERLEKAMTEVRTSNINDINLNRWKEYEDIRTDSLWIIGKRDGTGVHSAGYWGNFIPQIPNQMIRRYTKKGEWVLDTFVGCGTTLIAIGIELQAEVAERARELVRAEPNRSGVVSKVITEDSAQIDYPQMLDGVGQKSVQLLIMHPPYFDIIKFSKDPGDLSNASSVDAFLEMISSIVERAAAVLDKGRYFALVIGDKYSKGEWVPLGFLTMNEVLKRGFSLKSIIVKNFEETSAKRNQKELWHYRALVGGFYIFKHEYIFLFKKK